MRISSVSVFQDAVNNFNDMQSAISDTMNQISSGVALTSPSVNPTAAAQVLVASQGKSVNTQYGVNRQNATGALSTSDGVLAGATNLMQNLESLIVQAGNGSFTTSDKATMAEQFKTSMNQLMDLANSTDSNGNYMFSGSSVGTKPYVASSNGAVYQGNQVTQQLQVESSQQVSVTQVGISIFGNIQVSPNAYFSTPDGSNTSTATMSNGTVVTPAAVTNDNYSVTFTSPTAYDVKDTSTGVTVTTNNAYTSGAPIVIAGVQYAVTNGPAPNGTPAAGDQFTVQPGNQNIFQVLTNIMNAVTQPTTTAGQQTNFSNSLAQANAAISKSMNNVLNTRDQIGNSLQQLTNLDSVGSTVDLSYTTTISNLQDTNYAQAVSQLTQEQFTYKAAQQAFANTSQLSLINMIR